MALAFAPGASARSAPLDKVDGALLVSRAHAKPRVGGAVLAPKVTVSGGRALVDVYVNGPMRTGAKRLRTLGMRVIAVSGRPPQRMVEGWLPLDRLDEVA